LRLVALDAAAAKPISELLALHRFAAGTMPKR
jgi:hypothetical protein